MATTIPAEHVATLPGPAEGHVDLRAYRLTSIDMLRGLVIVIMALDHVRDFFMVAAEQDPLANPNVAIGLFATRWITHFCAPVFVLLAGVSAGLVAARRTRAELGRFLFTRGIWLIVVEIAVVSMVTSFAPLGIPQLGGLTLVSMQVIWAIGASMIVLAGCQWLGRHACLAVGGAILLSHNLLDPFWPASHILDRQWPLWVSLHGQMAYQVGPVLLVFVYPLLAWIGVMLAGYGMAGVFELPADRRNAWLIRGGLAIAAAFIAQRALDVYGDPNAWEPQAGGVVRTAIDFVNTTKYPPSLLFLLMTLGPAAVLCGLADRMSGPVKNALVVFGRVPFAFYVAHFALIHLLSVLLGVAQGFDARQMMTFFLFYPAGYGVSLPAVYTVWMLVVLMLYPLCRWMGALKGRRRDWWLSYV